ncbi:MAG: fluoride efflux transporter CrcB [Bacteroidetes bacterium]|nr:fluoride efflux transporter CrcB [Bacteroidota bacterium]
MMMYVLIFVGGGLGAVSRFAMASGMARLLGPTFPYGTLTVNVVGSFLIGLILTLLETKLTVFPYWRHLAVIGFLGGFTTFSSFSWETLALFRDGEFFLAAGNILLSVVLCLVFVWFGHLLGKLF